MVTSPPGRWLTVSKRSVDSTEQYECKKCGDVLSSVEVTIEVTVPLTRESWDLCDSCIDDLKQWIEAETNDSTEGSDDV